MFSSLKITKSKITNNSSISQVPQRIRQITHNAPFSNIFLPQNGALWDMVWGIVGFVQWVYWLTKNVFLVNRSEFLGIKRFWIEKTYTIDMDTWFLFTTNKNAFFNNFGTRLAQRAETGLFDPVIFTVSLSSIQCNHVGWPFSTKLRNVALIRHTLYLRHFFYKYVISFELHTRMAPGLRDPFQSFV